jgi:ankyrin repeat protein
MNLDEELIKAAENKDVARVKKLLTIAVKVNAKFENGKSPLHFAVELPRAYGFFPPECADIVKSLLEISAEVNAKDDFGRTPLHYATEVGWGNIVKILIEKGADVNIRDSDLNTPLHFAALGMIDIDRLYIARLLLKEGADPNAKNSDGETPLHWACGPLGCGDLKFIEELLNYGADVNARNRCGWTPLHYAASSHNSIVADLLLRNGAHVNARESTHEWTPLHVALQPVNPPCGATYTVFLRGFDLEIIGFIVLLTKNGAYLNARDKDGFSPLHYAAFHNLVYATWLLLNLGADPHVKDNEGRTLLDISAGVARPGALIQRAPLDQEIVNLLVEFTKKHRRIDGNVSAYLEESEQVPTDSKEETSLCPYCGRPAYRLGTLGRYYCFNCKRYV